MLTCTKKGFETLHANGKFMQSLRIQLAAAIRYLHLCTWSNYNVKHALYVTTNSRTASAKAWTSRENERRKKAADWHNWNRQEEFSRLVFFSSWVWLHFWDCNGCCTCHWWRVECGVMQRVRLSETQILSTQRRCQNTRIDWWLAISALTKKEIDYASWRAFKGEKLSQQLKVALLIIEQCGA